MNEVVNLAKGSRKDYLNFEVNFKKSHDPCS